MAATQTQMQTWERAEIERSSVEATLTSDAALRVGQSTFDRYHAPRAETAYPLEYAYHLLGDVTGRRIIDFGCGSGANTVLLANRGGGVGTFRGDLPGAILFRFRVLIRLGVPFQFDLETICVS